MRINSDQLSAQLQKPLQPIYWIAGDETLLVQEALDRLRGRCRQQGFTEWDLFFVDRSFSWQSMLQAGNSMSLFSDRKIIELRLYSPKLDEGGRQALQQYLSSPNPDNVLIIVSPKLETATLSTKWFKTIEASGVFVQVWPVEGKNLPRWIAIRMAGYGLNADADAIDLLAEKVEGNLLAADQEIRKLQILTGAGLEHKVHIGRKHIVNLVADSSRYNVFNLIDSALTADARRCLKIINGLHADGTEVLSLLGMVTRELRILIAVASRVDRGETNGSAMQREGVRKTHEGPVAQAIQRHSTAALESMLQNARRVDLSVKGLVKSDPWIELTNVLLSLSSAPPCTSFLKTD